MGKKENVMMKRKPNFDKYNTLLGVNAVVEGGLTVSDSARIDGTVHGSVTAQGNIVLGDKAEIDGDVTAVDMEIGGKVIGNLFASGRVFLTSTAKISGDIHTKSIVIDENAVF